MESLMGAFHAGNRGSNPLGDANYNTWPSDYLTAFFIAGVRGHFPGDFILRTSKVPLFMRNNSHAAA